MKLSEAPRCVPVNEFKERNTRSRTCLTAMFGISGEAFLELWFDLACEYAEYMASYPDSGITATQLIRNNLFWNYWVERWLERCDHFIWWKNPEKSIEDFKDFQREGLPPMKIFNLLIKTSTVNQ